MINGAPDRYPLSTWSHAHYHNVVAPRGAETLATGLGLHPSSHSAHTQGTKVTRVRKNYCTLHNPRGMGFTSCRSKSKPWRKQPSLTRAGIIAQSGDANWGDSV